MWSTIQSYIFQNIKPGKMIISDLYMPIKISGIVILSMIAIVSIQRVNAQNCTLTTKILETDNLVALWDFGENQDEPKRSKGLVGLDLKEGAGQKVKVVPEGPLSGKSILLEGDNFLMIPYEQTGALNIKSNQVTVIAWVKWEGGHTGFVGGMWNEYQDGGKRQYGLFVSLPYYNGCDQVCGHISQTGKPTPPFPYSIDYSASKQAVPANQWACVAFTYDGEYIRSYLNGAFEGREPELIDHTKGFPGYPDGLVQIKNPYHFPDGIGDNGSDFTVGAVLLKSGMGNFFKGQIGGLAVFNRALSSEELHELAMEEQNSPRQRLSLDENWRFHLGHATNPEKDFHFGTARLFAKTAENYGTALRPDFDDSTWENVNLPHDWAVALPFKQTPNGDVMSHGYKPVGGLYPENSIGWYRKTFDMSTAEDTTLRVVLTFDGVFRDSEVWVNNFYCGSHFSGYTGFSYDITDFIRYDRENVIVVRVDATKYEGWFYEGAGIYRHVWLNLFDNLHFTENGIFVHANLNSDFSEAQLTIQTEMENHDNIRKEGSVITRIFDRHGKQVAQAGEEKINLEPGEKIELKKQLAIDKPELWDLDTPHLYKAVSTIQSGNKIIDRVETRFGIRDIYVDADKGLFLNGKNIKIKGVCCHQDHAGVGSALPDYLQYYRIGLLKEMGVNAYRPAHNPPTPELLDACDSLGMLVLNETRLMNSGKEYMAQFEALVLRDRNHPSVYMWSIGNEEEVYQSSIEGKRIALSMMRKLRQLDPTRVATYGANVGNVTTGVNEVIPVRGFNYNLHGVDDYRLARPDQPVFGSEVGSTVTTRGIYAKDTVNCYLTDFDENYPPWASTAKQWWTMAAGRDWFMGGFVWTGFDYRGEPTPFHWPNINSHFGIMDMCGFPKNIYYYYQSWWTDKDMLHIAPHWNWKGKEDEKIKVWVNSNAETIEMFLNGKSLGKKEMPRNGHLQWEVPYTPGKLKAIAVKNGRKFEKTVETTTEPYQIVLAPSKTTLLADGRDAIVVNVSAVDKNGREVPDTNELVRFSVAGDAKIIGVGNGDPSSHEPDKCADGTWQRSLFNGKCQLILLAGTTDNQIALKASSDNIRSDKIIILQAK